MDTLSLKIPGMINSELWFQKVRCRSRRNLTYTQNGNTLLDEQFPPPPKKKKLAVLVSRVALRPTAFRK